MPNPQQSTERWRNEAQRLGLGELFLCKVESLAHDRGNPAEQGFDAAVEFQPDVQAITTRWQRRRWFLNQKLHLANGALIYDYKDMVEKSLAQPLKPNRFPCITPMWDNSARRKSGALIVDKSTPELYECWLRGTVEKIKTANAEPLLFINAWNEWAEGNHLEPCQRWGRAYLEATKRGLGA